MAGVFLLGGGDGLGHFSRDEGSDGIVCPDIPYFVLQGFSFCLDFFGRFYLQPAFFDRVYVPIYTFSFVQRSDESTFWLEVIERMDSVRILEFNPVVFFVRVCQSVCILSFSNFLNHFQVCF